MFHLQRERMGYWLLLAVWLAGWCCIPHLLLLNKRPTATLAWLWALILFPVFGPALYLMIGSEQVKRQRMKRRQDFRSSGSSKSRTAKRDRHHAADDFL